MKKLFILLLLGFFACKEDTVETSYIEYKLNGQTIRTVDTRNSVDLEVQNGLNKFFISSTYASDSEYQSLDIIFSITELKAVTVGSNELLTGLATESTKTLTYNHTSCAEPEFNFTILSIEDDLLNAEFSGIICGGGQEYVITEGRIVDVKID